MKSPIIGNAKAIHVTSLNEVMVLGSNPNACGRMKISSKAETIIQKVRM